jgi:hypothetical protein
MGLKQFLPNDEFYTSTWPPPDVQREKRKGVILIYFAILCRFVPSGETVSATIQSRAKSRRCKETPQRKSRTKTRPAV